MASRWRGCLSLRALGTRLGTTGALAARSLRPTVDGFHVGLTSITWREAWKYGERAFRYCQHDVGHALAALRFAASTLGWRVQLLPEWDDARLAAVARFGSRRKILLDAEPETPELLVRVSVNEAAAKPLSPAADPGIEWFGSANRLSDSQVEWPVIDEAIRASERKFPRARNH